MKEFIEKLRERLTEYYGDNADVDIKLVNKINNVILYGISVHREGRNISPIVYVESYYKDYQGGVSLDEILADMIKIYDEEQVQPTIADDIVDFQKVKDTVTYSVVNAKKNAKLLEEAVHINVLDLAIVFNINIEINDIKGTVLVKHELLDIWGISHMELLKIADINTRKLNGVEIIPMEDMLNEFIQSNVLDGQGVIGATPIFVITNRQRHNGACCILFTDVLKAFAEKVNSNLIIIPSSIHECLLIPETEMSDTSFIREMIKDVNTNVVKDADILSDNCYIYEKATNRLLIAK